MFSYAIINIPVVDKLHCCKRLGIVAKSEWTDYSYISKLHPLGGREKLGEGSSLPMQDYQSVLIF